MGTREDENVGGKQSGFALKCFPSSSLGEISVTSTNLEGFSSSFWHWESKLTMLMLNSLALTAEQLSYPVPEG